MFMTDKIAQFQGKNRWLSNFWNAPQEIAGQTYINNEQWYVMNKCENLHDQIMSATKPGQIKGTGRRCKMRENWDNVKLAVMKVGLNAKFTQNDDLKQKLLDTGDAILEEGNTWGDSFWGINKNPDRGPLGGQNHLGKLLMELRDELRSQL
jgi:ribA/ribD-fused uncharacterized protein